MRSATETSTATASSKSLPKLMLLDANRGWMHRKEVISQFLQERFAGEDRVIRILEAGCGRSWPIDLGNVRYELTGVDADPEALKARQKRGDLAHCIHGDLRTVDLPAEAFDVVYSCEVLEHVRGAAEVLDRMFSWLKPGGLAVLIFPDRDTAFGFATRVTPHRVHVAYHRYILHATHAGEPGHSPYPTVYDTIVSRRGLRDYCQKHGHEILLEYGRQVELGSMARWLKLPYRLCGKCLSLITFGRIRYEHIGLLYLIQKAR